MYRDRKRWNATLDWIERLKIDFKTHKQELKPKHTKNGNKLRGVKILPLRKNNKLNMHYTSFKLWLVISHILFHQTPANSQNFKYDFLSSNSWSPYNGIESTLHKSVARCNICLMTTTPLHKNHISYNSSQLMTNKTSKTTIVKLHRKIQQNHLQSTLRPLTH
jgi:hypothetical protein